MILVSRRKYGQCQEKPLRSEEMRNVVLSEGILVNYQGDRENCRQNILTIGPMRFDYLKSMSEGKLEDLGKYTV